MALRAIGTAQGRSLQVNVPENEGGHTIRSLVVCLAGFAGPLRGAAPLRHVSSAPERSRDISPALAGNRPALGAPSRSAAESIRPVRPHRRERLGSCRRCQQLHREASSGSFIGSDGPQGHRSLELRIWTAVQTRPSGASSIKCWGAAAKFDPSIGGRELPINRPDRRISPVRPRRHRVSYRRLVRQPLGETLAR